MYSFEQLVFDTANKKREECRIYFNDFFKEYNSTTYIFDPSMPDDDKQSVYDMFSGIDEIDDRALNVLEQNPYCVEAFYVSYKLSNDVTLQYYFNKMLNATVGFNELSKYHQNALLFILNCYCDFLSSIHNYTKAIKVADVLLDLDKNAINKYIDMKVFYYSQIEDLDHLYDLYLNDSFKDPACYIFLIVTCLKHEDEIKAKEVLSTFISTYPKANYIDHIWEMDSDKSPEANQMRSAISYCYPSICAIPFFFSWCGKNKEEQLLS